jgi:uncharacterized protein YjbJ (UPF0337 family)
MNRDQLKGVTKHIAGKMQEKAGKLVRSDKHQAKGRGKQVAGKIQKGVGDIKAGARSGRVNFSRSMN